MTDLRPRPIPDERSAPYWRAAAEGRLVLARCGRCQSFAHPPDIVCPHCGSTDPAFEFEPVSGRGRVCSWTIVRQSFLPGFDDDVPFVLVDVALEETAVDDAEIRMIGRLVEGPGAPLRIGDRVEAAFEGLGDDMAVPAFSLAVTP